MRLARYTSRAILAAAFVGGAIGAPRAEVMLSPTPDDRPDLRMDHWPADGWSVQRYDNLAEIRFPGMVENVTVDPSIVPDFAPDIEAIETEQRGGDTYIRLTLGCDCSVSLHGTPAAGVRIELVGATSEVAVLRGPAPTRAPVPHARGTASSAPRADGATLSGAVNVEDARNRLMQQLLKAAEAGLVDLAPVPGEDPAPAAPQETKTETAEAAPDTAETNRADAAQAKEAEPVPNAPKTAEAEPGMVAAPTPQAEDTSAKAVGVTEAPAEPSKMQRHAQCFPDTAFFLPDPQEEKDFAATISQQRQHLIGEFDAPVASAAMDLARTYIGAGFGAEARTILQAFAGAEPEAELLTEVGLLIENRPLPADAHIARTDCLGMQALWRAVAAALKNDGQTAVRDELLSGRALEQLPTDLRQFSAAIIGLAAARAGNWDGARRLEAIANRSITGLRGRLGQTYLLTAELAKWNEQPLEMMAALNAARRSDPEVRDKALLMQARALVDRDINLSRAQMREMIVDLGNLSRRDRGSIDGQSAFELETALVDRLHGRDQAIALLAHGAGQGLIDTPRYVDMLAGLAKSPNAPNGGDRPIALAYLDDPEKFAPALKQPGFRQSLARSMIDLGLPGLAEPFLQDRRSAEPELVASLAEAYLDVGDHRAALEATTRLPETAQKHHLLGRALADAGHTGEAAEHFASSQALSRDDQERLRVLNARIEAEIAEGAFDAALTASLHRLEISPSLSFAEQSAVLALQADQPEMPAAAADILKAAAPTRHEGLNLLFQTASLEQMPESQSELQAYMSAIDAEIELVEELLNDG